MRINNDAILIKMAEKKLSRQALAEKCGITYSNLSDGMRRGRLTTENLGKVAEVLGCKVEDIIMR